MGDRVSISFKHKDYGESVALFSHWGGEQFAENAIHYAEDLLDFVKKHQGVQPIDRLEPDTVMVDFIREITKDVKRIEHDLYLAKDKNEGDNSENGHFTIFLDGSEVRTERVGGFL